MTRVPPDIEAYWESSHPFSKAVTARLQKGVHKLFETEERVLFIAHSLGAVLAFDALAATSQDLSKITLLTMGSPLTHPPFFERLKGSLSGLEAWYNLSAKGDKICGPVGLLKKPEELSLINPLIQDDAPNPHHALGYLRHPITADLLAQWLHQ